MRSARLQIMLSDVEKKLWFSAAEQRDIPVSALIRRCMNAVATGKIDVPDVPKPTSEDNKDGDAKTIN